MSNKFKVGDRIRVVDAGHVAFDKNWVGMSGVVVDTHRTTSTYPVWVDLDEPTPEGCGKNLPLHLDEVELIPKPKTKAPATRKPPKGFELYAPDNHYRVVVTLGGIEYRSETVEGWKEILNTRDIAVSAIRKHTGFSEHIEVRLPSGHWFNLQNTTWSLTHE